VAQFDNNVTSFCFLLPVVLDVSTIASEKQVYQMMSPRTEAGVVAVGDLVLIAGILFIVLRET
jgi:hypothetical protein